MAQTLANLRQEAQYRSNQENKTLVSTPEWNRYVNESIGELYDMITSSFPHYYVSTFAFTLASSNVQSLVALAPLFYKVRGLDYLYSASNPLTVHPLPFAERNRYSNFNYQGNYNLSYVPVPPTLAADGDTLDIILDVWAEFIAVTAAIKGAIKEESSTDDLLLNKATVIARINASAPNRDGEPGQASDLMSPQPGESGRRYILSGTGLTVVGSDALGWV